MSKIAATRRQAIRELLRGGAIGSQEEVLNALGSLGFAVTQATVSRDLEHLGAIKVRRDGRTIYTLPETGVPASRNHQQDIFREWIRSVEPLDNMIVVKTPPGSAHLVGVVVDQARSPAIAGTICGDDTIFIAVRDRAMLQALVSWLSGAEMSA